MDQTFLKPEVLFTLVENLSYKSGWTFSLQDLDRGQGSSGLTFIITASVKNSYHDSPIQVRHLFPVPPAAYDERSWKRWLLDQVILVEQHEACEFFTLGEVRPYAPNHGPGRNPYTIMELGTLEDVETRALAPPGK